jgi:hypothetical protein
MTAPKDWGVLVNEVRINATRQGADWWFLFASRFEGTPRMTCLGMCIAGALWHVACDTKQDAELFAAAMVERGIPKSAVAVKRLSMCQQVTV